MAFQHQTSRRAVLHICYAAVRAAAAVYNPYADPRAMAEVAEALAAKIETFLTSKRDYMVEFTTSDADNFDYLCAILDEVHKTLPITQYFNVILHMERVKRVKENSHAATTVDSDRQGGPEDLDD